MSQLTCSFAVGGCNITISVEGETLFAKSLRSTKNVGELIEKLERVHRLPNSIDNLGQSLRTITDEGDRAILEEFDNISNIVDLATNEEFSVINGKASLHEILNTSISWQ